MRRSSILIPILAALATASVSSEVGGDLCTGGEATGTGLRGAYYSADPATGRPALVRVDPKVNAAVLRTLPAAFAARPPHTVRWCGWIRPIVSGPHRFGSGNPRLRIQVGRLQVGDKPVDLQAGRSYDIMIELPDPVRAGEFSLQWTPPFGATYDVPSTVLFPPLATVQPGC
jgi:hypothetical protein